MTDTAMAVLAVLLALAIFIPCALFASGKWRPGRDPEGETAEGELSITQRLTAIAILAVRQALPGGLVRRALPPGEDNAGEGGGTTPSPTADGGPGEDLPGWVDIEVTRTDRPDVDTPEPPKVETRRRPMLGTLLDRLEPWLPQRKPPARQVPPVAEVPPVLNAAAAGDLELDAAPVRLEVEQVTEPASPDRAQPGSPSPSPVTVTRVPTPVELEGVDMSEAPLVPQGDGTVTRLPTVEQLHAALATGGIERLRTWLRAFFKASSQTLTGAQRIHEDALAVARQTRAKYALALHTYNNVVFDRLDPRTINRIMAMLQQAHAEAVAAATVTRHTAALVVAAGGSPPAVAAAINALNNGHAAIETAVKSAPVRAVPNLEFYKH